MISVPEAARRWAISEQRIRQWLAEGRIPGAVRLNRDWAIPPDARKPKKIKPR